MHFKKKMHVAKLVLPAVVLNGVQMPVMEMDNIHKLIRYRALTFY